MKKYILILLMSLVFAGCVRPASDPIPLPTSTDVLLDFLDEPTGIPVVPSDTPDPDAATPEELTDTPAAAETQVGLTPEVITPTHSPTITLTATETLTPLPGVTQGPGATATLSDVPVGPALDPLSAFGGPRYIEDFDNGLNWVDSTNKLPDSSNILLEVENNQMRVTGKNQEFDTWWFTAPTLGDFYIEMAANSGDCKESDSYGFILRGAATGEPARGYIVAISCDGNFFVRRLDSASPYIAQQIFVPTPSGLIRAGANQPNVLGVLMEDDIITIYVNSFPVAFFTDTTYEFGRYGVFVKAGPTQNYTYIINQIRVWDRSGL